MLLSLPPFLSLSVLKRFPLGFGADGTALPSSCVLGNRNRYHQWYVTAFIFPSRCLLFLFVCLFVCLFIFVILLVYIFLSLHICLPVPLAFCFFQCICICAWIYVRCNPFTVPCHCDVLIPQLWILRMPIKCGLREPAITRAKTASNCANLLITAFATAVPSGLIPKN